MRILSKSKLLAFRQCPKRLWLELFHPEHARESATTQAGFTVGHQVGHIAQQKYDSAGNGRLIDLQTDGFDIALAQSLALIKTAQPIFEAGFEADGALAFADILLPIETDGEPQWRMVEIKSSSSVKDYQRDDAAIQAFVARAAGVPLAGIALAHIDSTWVYPGDGDYSGLLVEEDLTQEAFAREDEVRAWIADAQSISVARTAPAIATGRHCHAPFDCAFLHHCQAQEPQATHPVQWLPSIRSGALKDHIGVDQFVDMDAVPDALLSERQLRVKQYTLSGSVYFDAENAAADLAAHVLPAYFLDFETIQFPVPLWRGTRPYQQIPFQFSLHHLAADGVLSQQGFLDISGNDPSLEFANALIAACGDSGAVFVYNAGFETARIRELAERFPELGSPLHAINARVVDLLPVARNRYYHPSQQGSWSIKKVLPAIAPDLRYDDLDGVQDGGMAMLAFMEAIAPTTLQPRRVEIENQLLKYCALDTFAMVRLWQFFTGNTSLLRSGA